MKQNLLYRLFWGGMFFFFMLFPAGLRAQEVAERLDHLIPPSPGAAALTRAGNVVVSLYTGSPSVQIPLWTLKGDVVSVPVYLSYHSTGMKVGEIPGWTGLGWTLHAGGAITRMVKGRADDLPKGYLESGKNFLHLLPYVTDPFNVWQPAGHTVEEQFDMLHLAAYGQIDLEPDLFSYNFPGHSGQFFLDTAGRPVLLSPADLQITYTRDPNGNIIAWKIIDDKGVTYLFGGEEAAEKTMYFTPNGSPSQMFYSAWHVSEITSANGEDLFYFRYDGRSEERRYPVSLKKVGNRYPSWDDLYKYSSTTILEKYPKEIVQSFGDSSLSILFIPQVLEEYPGGTITALRQVVVNHPRRNAPDRRFYFDYSFFPSTGCGTDPDYLRPCKRLRLDKITEQAGRVRKPPYMFFYDPQPLPPRGSFARDLWGYYNGRQNETPVPALTVENSHDPSALDPQPGWSGAFNYDWFLQAHLNLSYADEKVWQLPGADRRPDTIKVQAGLLKRIVYPTGGTTLLEYEPNKAGYIMMPAPEKRAEVENTSYSSLYERVSIDFDQEVRFVPLFYRNPDADEISPYCSLSIVRSYISQDEEKDSVVFSLTYKKYKDRGGYDQEFRFILKAGTYKLYAISDANHSLVRGYLFYHDRTPEDHVYPIYSNDYEKTMVRAGFSHFPDDSSYTVTKDLTIGSEDDPLVHFSWYFRSDVAPNLISTATLEHPYTVVQVQDLATGEVILDHYFPVNDSIPYDRVEGYHWSGEEILRLQPGRYRVIFRPRVPLEAGYLSAVYNRAVKTHPWAVVGGVRLKRKVDLDHYNDTVLLKEYAYTTLSKGRQWSSGVLMRVPLFWDEPEDFYYLGTSSFDQQYFPLSVYSLARVEDPLTMGNHVGYAEVTEKIPGNGRTVSYFTSPLEYPDISQLRFPFAPATSFDWKRGALKERFVYGREGRVREHTVTEYNALHDSVYSMGMPSVKVVQKDPKNIYTCRYTVSLTRAGWNHPMRRDHWQYDTTGVHTFHTLETYVYSPSHYRLQQQVTFTSDSQRLVKRYRYPADMPADLPGIQALRDRHMTGVLVQEERLADTVPVSGYRVIYGRHGDRVVPDSVEVLEGDTYRARTFFDRYDAQGRLLQYHRSGDVYHAVNRDAWGHPAIIADNAEYDASGNYPATALVTRYSYDPLFGVQATEDANGNITRYSYDPLGRLTLVRDPQGRIVKKVTYRYRSYRGDTTRPVYTESSDRPSLPADTILLSVQEPVLHCPVDLTVSGGSLGTGAQWHWYRDGCAVTPAGTGNTLTVYPAGRESYFVRAEGKVNNTRCRSITLVPVDPVFRPDRDTLFVGADGTNRPLAVLPGFTGCEPWQAGVAEEWIGVEQNEGDELLVTVAPNGEATSRSGRILLQASGSSGRILVVQEGTAAGELTLHLQASPDFVTPGTEVTVTATAENGTDPYLYVWEKRTAAETSWSLIGKRSSDDPDDQVTVTAGTSDLYIRCTLTSDGKTCSETIMIKPAL